MKQFLVSYPLLGYALIFVGISIGTLLAYLALIAFPPLIYGISVWFMFGAFGRYKEWVATQRRICKQTAPDETFRAESTRNDRSA